MLIDVALLKDLDESWPRSAVPPVLWHYTSLPAAQAILQSRQLHLGCHAFMNDPAEGAAAAAIVKDCWSCVIDRAASHKRLDLSQLRDLTETIAYFDYERPELPPTFLFSLTELRDSLGQWSRYGDNGAGVALGFSFAEDRLPQATERPWKAATTLNRVEYNEEMVGGELAQGAQALVGQVLEKYLPQFRDPTEIQNTLIALIHHLNPMIKRSSYSEEREWRLVTRTVADSSESYEIGCNKYGFSPYVPLSFDKGVRLAEVMLGPKLSPENRWSAKWLCKKYGHEAQTSVSSLSYR